MLWQIFKLFIVNLIYKIIVYLFTKFEGKLNDAKRSFVFSGW